MNNYLGHQFNDGMCMHCGATERIVRQFRTECANAIPVKPEPKIATASDAEFDANNRASAIESLPKSENRKSSLPISPPLARYSEAYLVARLTWAAGNLVRFAGIGLGILIAIGSLVIAPNGSDGIFIFGGILIGALVALPIFMLGILLSAQAQVLKATLDTAVQTSPFLSKQQMAETMGL